MNVHAYPLTATVTVDRAASGMHSATVDTGMTDMPHLFVGYLDRASALAAGERFALAMGRRPIMPDGEDRGDRAPVRVAKHGDGRRRARRHVRAAKAAWLDSGI